MLLAFLSKLGPLLRQPDMGWHLAQARWMYTHGQVLTQNWFNYPLWGQPLINEYSFYHLLLWPLWSLGAWPASLAFALLAAGLILALFLFARRTGFYAPGFAIGAVLATPLLLYRLSPRPEMLGYLFLILLAFWLFHLQRKSLPLWQAALPLLLLQVCWVNSHSSFILGPVLVGLFSAEVIAREVWQKRHLPWRLIGRWAALTLTVGLACFISPQPIERAFLPFFHQGSKAILAHVDEMHGLIPDLAHPFVFLMLLLGVCLVVAWWSYRNISFSFLLLTGLFAFQTFQNQRHITMFAFLALLTLATCAAWKKPSSTPKAVESPVAPRFALLALLLLLFAFPLILLKPKLDTSNTANFTVQWQALERDQSLVPVAAIAWLKANQVDGRLLHRTEIGGHLQFEGLSAQCFADTGLGKYHENFIYQACQLCERPGLLPAASRKEKASVALVSNVAYDWPAQLRKMGWRCVFTSANGAVWMAPDYRPDLTAIAPGEVERRFLEDTQRFGPPAREATQLCHLLLLSNQGAEELALEQLLHYAQETPESGLLWQTASLLAFPSSTPERNANTIQTLAHLAQEVDPDGLGNTAGYQAQTLAWQQAWPELLKRYATYPRERRNDALYTALGEAYVASGQTEDAMELLQDARLFHPLNGTRYQLLARAWAKKGDPTRAAQAYAEALYCYPDDERLQNEVERFLLLNPTSFLRESLKNARHVF